MDRSKITTRSRSNNGRRFGGLWEGSQTLSTDHFSHTSHSLRGSWVDFLPSLEGSHR